MSWKGLFHTWALWGESSKGIAELAAIDEVADGLDGPARSRKLVSTVGVGRPLGLRLGIGD